MSPRVIYLRNWRKKSRPSPLKPSHVSNCKNHIILYLCSPGNLFVQPGQSFARISRQGCIVWKTVPIALWETCHIQVHQYNLYWLYCVKVCDLIWCANMATRIVLACKILCLCFCLCLINGRFFIKKKHTHNQITLFVFVFDGCVFLNQHHITHEHSYMHNIFEKGSHRFIGDNLDTTIGQRNLESNKKEWW